MFKISKDRRELRAICDVLVQKTVFVRSCELYGYPRVGYDIYNGEMVNPSWVWPARIELINGEVHFGCFVFDESTCTASFGDEKFYRWKERNESFLYSDEMKQISFYPGMEPKSEVFYDENYIRASSLSLNEMKKVVSEYVASQTDEYTVERVFFKIMRGCPYYIAELALKGTESVIYYELPVGLAYHTDLLDIAKVVTVVTAEEINNPKIYSDPKPGKSYLVSGDAMPHCKKSIGVYLMAVECTPTDFRYVSFKKADFAEFKLSDNI